MIDRERELQFLRNRAASGSPELIVLWGRRRLGKTTLLKALCEEVPSIYFLATRAPAHEQLQRISTSLSERFDDPLLKRSPLTSWEDVFLYLNRHLRERTLFVVDEFPHLVEADSAIPSRFQFGWDEYLAKNDRAVLILNGSSLSMMEGHVLGSKSPLYGRRTGQWQIQPLDLVQCQGFFPGLHLVDLIENYAILGGVPFYILQFDASKPLSDNVKERILSKGCVLYQEVPFLFHEEVREPRSYFPILAAISQGSRKFGEISSKAGLDKSNLSKYLSVLEDLRIITREVPITEQDPLKSRKGLYFISDPFVDFWLRYVWPNMALLELERVDEVWQDKIAPDLCQYVGIRCERYMQGLLAQPRLREWMGFQPDRIGKYWDPTVELDLVALDDKRSQAVIGEVKWSRSPVDARVASSLQSRAERALPLRPMKKRYLLFSRSGFTPALRRNCPEDLLLVDLSSAPSEASS